MLRLLFDRILGKSDNLLEKSKVAIKAVALRPLFQRDVPWPKPIGN
jgi:hypothetical protein